MQSVLLSLKHWFHKQHTFFQRRKTHSSHGLSTCDEYVHRCGLMVKVSVYNYHSSSYDPWLVHHNYSCNYSGSGKCITITSWDYQNNFHLKFTSTGFWIFPQWPLSISPALLMNFTRGTTLQLHWYQVHVETSRNTSSCHTMNHSLIVTVGLCGEMTILTPIC